MAAGRFSPWFLLVLTPLMAVIMGSKLTAASAPAAIFIFGDSTVDVGTNNFIPESKARADFPYNGIDYPYSVPTGRFSNGFNTADQLVRLFGCKRSPQPFLSLLTHSSSFKKKILQGVNFASGGSGVLDTTGQIIYIKVIPLSEQIKQYSGVKSNISAFMGAAETAKMLSNSLFLISIGSNDIFDYLLNPNSSTSEFLVTLQATYFNHLKNLYAMGARKFGIIGVAPIGCCPIVRLQNYSGGCFEKPNELAQAFNNGVETLLKQLSSELQGMKYAYGNSYEMTMTIIQDPYTFGIKDVQSACCGGGTLNARVPCNQTATFCRNRHEYLFWDQFHPTQMASQLAALTLYGGSTRFVTPMNFSQLID